MNLLSTFKTYALRIALMLAVAMLGTASAFAQFKPTVTKPAAFPAGLTWKAMPEVTFNFDAKYASPAQRPDQQQLAQSLWSDEISKRASGETATPVFVLTHSQPLADLTLNVAIINLSDDYVRCEQPLNGKNVVDMYAKCLMRVSVSDGKRAQVAQFNDFCYLYIDNSPKDAPLAQNHTEIAVDPKSSTAYFRVIQFGKTVRACNRAVRLS
jgi:hypothetical protein